MTMIPTTPCRVLVVDDEPLIRWSIAETLAERGYSVTGVGTADEALRLVASPARFGVILLDLRLPDSKDLGLLERLRALSPASRVIMMTAYGTPAIAQGCARLGATDCMDKPFRLAELTALIAAEA